MPPDLEQHLDRFDDRQMCAGDRPADQDPDHQGDDDRRMCADGRPADQARDHHEDQLWGITGRIHVSFVAPRSVSMLLRSVMQGFASPTEPRWKAFERLLEQVLDQGRNQPRHRDPVFERDGYRCSAPACSSFTNLHGDRHPGWPIVGRPPVLRAGELRSASPVHVFPP